MRDLLDQDGENRAVRAFLMLYGGQSVTAKQSKCQTICATVIMTTHQVG